MYKALFIFLIVVLHCGSASSQSSGKLIRSGWSELVKDHDDSAFRYFNAAFENALKENNTADKAEALLYLGICTYGVSHEEGMKYATQALETFRKLEKTDPETASVGRGRCLQLIATIYSRQKKYEQSAKLSREAISLLQYRKDTTGTLGLAYSSVGQYHKRNNRIDSATHYFRLSMFEFEHSAKLAYLPEAYIRMSTVTENNISKSYILKGLEIARSTENKQAEVGCLLALGKFHMAAENKTEAATVFTKALSIAEDLNDKTYEIKVLNELISLEKENRNYDRIAQLQERLLNIKDDFNSTEKEKIVKNLEVRFEVAEKNRKIELLAGEQKVSAMTNYLLGGGIVILLFLLIGGYIFYRGIRRRDRDLLSVKEALVISLEEQRSIREEQFRNDIAHRESELSAITLHMVEKNELLQGIRSLAETENSQTISREKLLKMVDGHLQNNGWHNFNEHFESVNRDFYKRLRELSDDISPNDLRICALIRLNLSIKEMAAILNISPDSVKTARYRLRKKLGMSPEDSLTNFILSI